MGDHRHNPVALAARNGQPVRVLDIGEGYGLLGVGLQPMIHVDDDTGAKSLAVLLVATGGKVSQLAPMQPVSVVLGEFPGRLLTDVYKAIDDGLLKARETEGQ